MAIMDRDRWRVLEPLLDRALELTPDERASWLADLRQRTPAVAEELTSLLSGEEAADRRGFLAEPFTPTLDGSFAGVQLGPYTLERLLGQGGMGSVWLARRTDGQFEGFAAVKLLNVALSSAAGQARFRREGSLLARLAHPGIARLLDAGVSPSGQPYLVLEHIDGERIDTFATTHAVSSDGRIGLLLQVLDAVGHAHAHLIVHRDLKPSNILVTPDGVVKLLDFGIAKLIDADPASDMGALTREGSGPLTPQFAAPEQLHGDAITTATDVYALGLLLHALLAGRLPPRDTAPPSLDLGDLDTVLLKALRQDPSERYQTVEAFADDLRRYLAHEPVGARPDSIAYRMGKFVRRHRAGVALATGIGAALLAATVFSVAQMHTAQRERDAAIFATRRANALIEFQSLLMSELGDRPLTMREILDRSRVALEGQYVGDSRLVAALLVQLSAQYGDLGDNTTQHTLLARAESIAVAGGYPDLAEIRCHQASALRGVGRYDEARRTLRAADAILHAAPDAPVEATCLQSLSDLEAEAGDPHRAVDAARRAVAIRQMSADTTDLTFVGLLSTLATSLDLDGHPRDAIALYRRAGALMDSTGRGETLTRGIIEHDMAVTYVRLGETAEAERLLHDVIERTTRSDPAGHLPEQALIHYAHTALFNAHFDSAAKYFAVLAGQAAQTHNAYWQGRALFGLAQAQIRGGARDLARGTMTRFRPLVSNPALRSTDDQVVDDRFLDAWMALASGDSATAHERVVDVLRSHGYFDGKKRRVFRSALILAAETTPPSDTADALGFIRAARAVASVDSLTDSRSAYAGEADLLEARTRLAVGDTLAARAALTHAVAALRFGAGAAHPRLRQAEERLARLGATAR